MHCRDNFTVELVFAVRAELEQCVEHLGLKFLVATEDVEEINDHGRRVLLELCEHFRGLIDEKNDAFGDNEAIPRHHVGQEELDELADEGHSLGAIVVLNAVKE